jgi:hypothetical protein
MFLLVTAGALIAVLNVILSYWELVPFLKSLEQLNTFSKTKGGINLLLYPFRFVALLPKLKPLIIDITISMVCCVIGLSGGLFGALITISIGFTASILVKIHRYWIAPRMRSNTCSWR